MSFAECNRILNLFGISMKDQIFDLLVRQVDKDHSGGLVAQRVRGRWNGRSSSPLDAAAAEDAVPLPAHRRGAPARVDSLASLTRRDNALGNLSHLSYNATRLEIERPIMVVADVKLDGRASRPSS